MAITRIEAEAGLEDIRSLFVTEWEGSFDACYRRDYAPEDMIDTMDRALVP